MKIDPIIAVKDVEKSSKWYQEVFDLKSIHGGDEFDVLIDSSGEVMLCLHKWGEHDHPTMQSAGSLAGNGLILYFRINDIEAVRERLRSMNYKIEKEMAISQNSHKKEFAFRDLDGYYLTLSEYHSYKG